jgi:hypothetical protein
MGGNEGEVFVVPADCGLAVAIPTVDAETTGRESADEKRQFELIRTRLRSADDGTKRSTRWVRETGCQYPRPAGHTSSPPSDVPFRVDHVPTGMNANSPAARGRNPHPVRYA